jgi:hypothetical protein
MEYDGLSFFFEGLNELKTKQKEKIALIGKYYPPTQAVIYFLLLKLSTQQIKEVCKKYQNSEEHSFKDLIDELAQLCGIEKHPAYFLPKPAKEVTLYDMQWLCEYLNEHWRKEQHELWSRFWEEQREEKKKKIESISFDSKFRGKKVSPENREMYGKIHEADQERIKTGEDSNFKQSTKVVAKQYRLSTNESKRLYKNFIEWKNHSINKHIHKSR